MRLTLAIAFAGLLILASLAAAGLALKQRFDQGAKTRIAICRSNNDLRLILHDEHTRKLEAAREQLVQSLHFLNGHRAIPAGFTREDVVRSVRNERASIALEKNVIARTRPLRCK